jgi:hypothetical protein
MSPVLLTNWEITDVKYRGKRQVKKCKGVLGRESTYKGEIK